MKRNILVTGGNRGIGRAIVELMAESDDQIILGCRNPDEVKDISKSNITIQKLDLSSDQSILKSCNEIKNKFQHLDCLINNAGVLIEEPFLEVTTENFEYTYQVNVKAPYLLTKFFIPEMIKRDYGRIVNISSGWGSFSDGLTGPFSYSYSKACLNAFTVTAAKNLPKNIKINSMCPGWVKTRMGGDTAPRTPEQGAETAIWLANADEDSATGQFFRDKKMIPW
jgi:NAD(P)-dependent dehydrogenase (short-subunit alcohol dehydrogenase family)